MWLLRAQNVKTFRKYSKSLDWWLQWRLMVFLITMVYCSTLICLYNYRIHTGNSHNKPLIHYINWIAINDKFVKSKNLYYHLLSIKTALSQITRFYINYIFRGHTWQVNSFTTFPLLIRFLVTQATSYSWQNGCSLKPGIDKTFWSTLLYLLKVIWCSFWYHYSLLL